HPAAGAHHAHHPPEAPPARYGLLSQSSRRSGNRNARTYGTRATEAGAIAAMCASAALKWALVMTLASSAAAGGELPCDAHYGDAARAVRVATGSPGELGLLRELALAFHGGHGAAVCWRKAGTGKALELLRAGDVDVVLVHAPDAERAAVAGGWAASRTLIGGNEFFIVGPAADPAGVAAAGSAVEAFRRIARAGAPFVSRADNSGTHQRETAIWREAGVQPAGAWYVEAPGFMVEG